jgi:hypothetical protein
MMLIDWETMFWETSIPLHQHLEHKPQILQTSLIFLSTTINLQLTLKFETMFANVME